MLNCELATLINEGYAPYTEVTFKPVEVLTSSVNEHGYIIYGHKIVHEVRLGNTTYELEAPEMPDIDLDLL